MSGDVLSLAELEAHDPEAPGRGRRGNRRFLCPLPACADKRQDAAHRNLSANMDTGLWNCKCCKAAGLLAEFRTDRPRETRRERARRALARSSALPPATGGPQSPGDARAAGKETPAGPPAAENASETPSERVWRRYKDPNGRKPLPLAGTPGAAYLEARGIPLELAERGRVLYDPEFFGRPAVVFPVRDVARRSVAVHGRHTDGRDDPKAHNAGPIAAGVYWTPGARESEALAITEAPVDALSLAAAGLPGVALCGTALRLWLPLELAWRRVLLAFDADGAGEKAAKEWLNELRLGTHGERLRPDGAKDWNEILQREGLEALRAAIAPALAAAACPLCVPGGAFCARHDPFR